MFQERYKFWSENPYFDEETRAELSRLQDPKEIEDRFYTDLEFGTGGLRGILAAGRNRMNKYVVRKVTQGLADLIAEYGQQGKERGVVIAYDSRRFSPEFALEAALVLARNGIKSYLFESLRPTPELSFAVRYLHTLAGIVITASHNPKEYNGYKVYWEDGGQVPPEQANRILAKIQEREDWVGIEPLAQDEARRHKLLVMIGEEIDRAYLKKVQGLSIHPQLSLKSGNKLKIIFTPLHGAGTVLVPKALAQAGFHSVFVVPEQEMPDPEFTTVPFPNPEIPSTFDLARTYALKQGADLILATDPDADRLGVAVRTGDGSYVQLTGNQAGVVLMHYILEQKQASGTLPAKAAVIKTIASTDLADEVARSFQVKVENVLTGFKFIAEKVHEMEEEGWGQFQFGFEESYGYLAGTFVRDKDGIIAAVLLAEAALYYKMNGGRTLLDVMEDLYIRFGYYIEDQKSFTLEGIEGKEQMAKIMHHLRSLELRELGGIPVERIDDYELRFGKRLETGEVSVLTLPRSDVLRFSFRGGGFVMARPSGTEPKIKFYFSVKEEKRESLEETLQRVQEDILARVHEVLT